MTARAVSDRDLALKSVLIRGVSIVALSTVALPVGGAAISPAKAQTDRAMDEVLVTARRREERLLDVPISITTFSSDRLEQFSARSLADIGNFVPNLFYTDRSTLQTDITIRGVGGDARNIGIESGIGLYIDGVYAGRTSAYNMDLADIQQIEVLRGPQGTLFGKNTTGGAINITTRRPSDEFEVDGLFAYGNFNTFRFAGSVSGPITDTLSAKLRVATLDRDGYITNEFNGEDVQDEQRRAVLGQLRYQPNKSWDILLSVDYTVDDRNVIQNQLGSDAAFGAGFFNPDRFVINVDQPNTAERDMLGVSLNAVYEFDSGHRLTWISAYRDTEITVFSDIDQTPNRVFDSGPFTDNAEQFTQEIQFASPGNQFIDYLAGVYFYRQDA
ncbi:MAG: TonB-dependent receptor plug domain-containing protein, partial [Pseudomonadota bacterium]